MNDIQFVKKKQQQNNVRIIKFKNINSHAHNLQKNQCHTMQNKT